MRFPIHFRGPGRAVRLRVEPLERRLVPGFLAPAPYPVGPGPVAAATADFDGDGRPDLAVAESGGNGVRVLLGRGDGSLQIGNSFAAGTGPLSVAVGDFDGDGRTDVATTDADGSGGAVGILLGHGDGTLASPQIVPLPFPGLSVAVGDMNADGKLDLVAASVFDNTTPGWVDPYTGQYFPPTGSFEGYISVLLGHGNGTFAAPATYQSTPDGVPEGLAAADFNGDGRPDVATVSHTGTLSVFLANADGTLRGPAAYDLGPLVLGVRAVAAADLNADGQPDLAVAGAYGLAAVLLGNADGSFQAARTYAAGDSATDVVVVDVNGDGRPDLVTGNAGPWDDRTQQYGDGFVHVLLGRGDGTFAPPLASPVSPNAGGVALAAADLNADGRPDLTAAVLRADSVAVLLNDGVWPSAAAPSLSVSDVQLTEGNTGTTPAVFTVTLSAPPAQTVTVRCATADGSAIAGSDYQATSGTLTFAPGERSKTIAVAVIGDRLAEGFESFLLNLSDPTNAFLAQSRATGVIVDDEPNLYVRSTAVSEGNTGTVAAAFAVTLSAASDVPVTVNYGTMDGTATAGSDYRAASGTLTFAAGETTKSVTVLVNGDVRDEYDETFYVRLSNVTNAGIAGAGSGTILDDDPPPAVTINDVRKSEGDRGAKAFVFTVTLSAPSDKPVSVSFATADGTATAADGDFQATAGTLTFAPGETTGTITVRVYGDKRKEADETLTVNLTGAASASILDGTGLGTILNDD